MFQVTSNIQDILSDETAPAVHRLIKNMIGNESKKPIHRLNECDVLSIAEKEVLPIWLINVHWQLYLNNLNRLTDGVTLPIGT